MVRRSILMAMVATTAAAVAVPSLAQETIPSAGWVVKIDLDVGKITIMHKPIAHLYMESMTMIFRVKDAAMLTGLTPGDKIRFEVERANGSYVITRIENAN